VSLPTQQIRHACTMQLSVVLDQTQFKVEFTVSARCITAELRPLIVEQTTKADPAEAQPVSHVRTTFGQTNADWCCPGAVVNKGARPAGTSGSGRKPASKCTQMKSLCSQSEVAQSGMG
jgi:hypothetical protein